MTTTLQTRIDAKLKRDAKKALGSMGLDMSTGVKMFLTQVVRTQSIPFQVFTFDNLSSKKKQALIKSNGCFYCRVPNAGHLTRECPQKRVQHSRPGNGWGCGQ